MRRLLRWGFNGAAVVSAVPFVATCVLWVRSYCRAEAMSFTWRGARGEVVSSSGGLTFDNYPQRFFEWERRFDDIARIADDYHRNGGFTMAAQNREQYVRALQEVASRPTIDTPSSLRCLPYCVPSAAAIPLPILAILWVSRMRPASA